VSAEIAIVLEQARVELGGRTVLGPIDLVVSRGEHLLIVGPSGSGKTTLLGAIAGLQGLVAGRIALFGRPANEGRRTLLAPHLRRVGYLFQGGALWPHMSVRETLAFVLRCRGVPARERDARIGGLLETVELTGFEKRKPGTMSGGETQRLSLARALAMDPEILLLDEPLGPLDAELRASMLERLGEVQKRLHLTTLHVTHDPREVEGIAERTIRLERGSLVPLRAEVVR
jgi:ABC-type sulfate/molybdate transport systems ATPase subunit